MSPATTSVRHGARPSMRRGGEGGGCDWITAHLKNFSRNVDANVAYVVVSRDSAEVGAIDETLAQRRVSITAATPLRPFALAIA